MPPRLARRGFSLLEVLVALAIGGICMAAVAHSAWAIVRGRRYTEIQEAASLVAERRLEEMLARGAETLRAESASESIPDLLGQFDLRTIVEVGPRENLWHVSVTATPPRGGAPVRFHTLLRRAWSVP
jgi:prepilin-type N-terminal cleavage/methylation domain-containing protein